jgi:hypothetical protein
MISLPKTSTRSLVSRCTALLLFAGAMTSCADQLPGELDGDDPAASGANRGAIGAELADDVELKTGALVGPAIDPRKSLIVTDQQILANFSLASVLPRLQPTDPGVHKTALQMFQQLWATYLAGGNFDAANPRCNDNFPQGAAPVECPRLAEGNLSTHANLLNEFVPTALVNRVDLMPANGAHCGEFRIVYARVPNTATSRALVIFEGALPNPNPAAGRKACLPVQQFWQNLSAQPIATRATNLRNFYFSGLAGFSPVLTNANFGANNGQFGQVRANTFMQSAWNLREFKMRPVCGVGTCQSTFQPATVKVTPLPSLFADFTDARTVSFQNEFITKVAGLAVNNLNTFNYVPSAQFNIADNNAQDPANLYPTRLGPLFRNRIQAELTRIGSPLTAAQIAARAEALSCSGCHQESNNVNLGGGLIFPPSLGFVHVGDSTEVGPEGTRFRISTALNSVFLPNRKAIMEQFLTSP